VAKECVPLTPSGLGPLLLELQPLDLEELLKPEVPGLAPMPDRLQPPKGAVTAVPIR
jgi:hypothetical protein